MKYEFNARGKAEFAEPETWARAKGTITLVNRLLKGALDSDSVTDKERARLNRWVTLGYATKKESTAKKTKPRKTKTTKTAQSVAPAA